MVSFIAGKFITQGQLMLSRSRIQFLISLQKKKVRDSERLYLIEGDKLVREYLMAGTEFSGLIATPEFINSLPGHLLERAGEFEQVSYEELKKISTLKTPHNALAIVPMPDDRFDPDAVTESLCVALDFIQDPGNLGTIIRAASWFGIRNIICSDNCVDVYNPKVIQATMGAILNVGVYYRDLNNVLEKAFKAGVPVYAAVLDGSDIYETDLAGKGIIVLGNESRGVSGELMKYVTVKLTIPKFTGAKHGIDSLNAGMAASVILSEFARRGYSK